MGADGSFAVPLTVTVPRTSSNLLKKSARRLLSVRNPDEAFWFGYTFRDGLIASLETHLNADLAEQQRAPTKRRRTPRAP